MFLVSFWTQQNFQRWYCLREPPGRLCDVGCCCYFWPHWRFFISLLYDVIPHPSVGYRREFYTPFCTFSPSHRSVIRDNFHFNFSRVFIFTTSATVLSGHFFSHTRFLPYTPSFVTQVRAGTPHPGSSSVPALTELSLPADAWAWTIYVWITRPLIYQLRQWATKYRVKVELLNMFRLFKVIWKDHKNTLNKAWYTA